MSREPLLDLNLLAAVVSFHARSEGSVDSRIDPLVTKREGTALVTEHVTPSVA